MLLDIIQARLADDTQNTVEFSCAQHMLDNNNLWCLATGGGTQQEKQELSVGDWKRRQHMSH